MNIKSLNDLARRETEFILEQRSKMFHEASIAALLDTMNAKQVAEYLRKQADIIEEYV